MADADAQLCKLAIDCVSARTTVKFPAYPEFGSTFITVCKEEAYEELDLLVDDFSQGFAESVILEQISEDIEIKEQDEEPLCSFVHHILDTFSPPPKSLNLAQISTKVSKKELESMQTLVEKQAILLKPDSATDRTLLKLLIIGEKHHFPVLTYLIDLYGRYRLLEYQSLYERLRKIDVPRKRTKYIAKNFKNVMEIPDFFKKCRVMKELQHKKQQTDVNSENALLWYEASMQSFFRRLYGPLKMIPQQMVYKINDNILDYATYYITLLTTVNNFIQTANTKLPLQIDFWVIPKAMTMSIDHDDDYKSESDDDIDPNSDDDDDDDDDPNADGMSIDDLQERLKYTDNLFSQEITNKDLSRTTFYRAIEQVIGGKRSKRMVMIVDRRINGKDCIENKVNYSHKNQDNKQEEKGGDTLYAYLPKTSQDIPSGRYLHEALFNLSKVEVLPSVKGNAIHALSDLSVGNMCLLSVQIHEETMVRAYWFMNGSGSRFYVNDMVNIWPLYFIEKRKEILMDPHKGIDEYQEAQYQDVNPIIDLIESKVDSLPLQDAKFDTFFETNTGISPSRGYAKKLEKFKR